MIESDSNASRISSVIFGIEINLESFHFGDKLPSRHFVLYASCFFIQKYSTGLIELILEMAEIMEFQVEHFGTVPSFQRGNRIHTVHINHE